MQNNICNSSNLVPLILFVTISTLTFTCITNGTIVTFQSEASSVTLLSLFLSLLILFTINVCLGLSTFIDKNFIFQKCCPMESLHMILTSILCGFWLFCRSFAGECPTSSFEFYDFWSCNPQFDTDTLPADTMIVLMLIPFVYLAIYGDQVSGQVLLLAWFITISWLFICIVIFQARNSIFSVVFYTLLSFFSLFQTKLQFLKLYTELNDKDEEAIRIKTEVEASTKEIQNMVSNVTHDLKSPLAVVTASVISVKDAISNSKKSFKSGQATAESLMEEIKSIEDSMKHVNVMNIFMVDSINRVLDCSKVQTGMKLVPKHETLHINEALELPITCMTTSQNQIGIELLPMGLGISSHIITDKQWFQENIICLLSNAVKYSSTGTVTIAMSLVQLSDLPCESVARGAVIRAKEQQADKIKMNDSQSSLANSNNATPRSLLTSSRTMSLCKFSMNLRSSNKVGVFPLQDESSEVNLSETTHTGGIIHKNQKDLEMSLDSLSIVPITGKLANSNTSLTSIRQRSSFDELASANMSPKKSTNSDTFLLIEVQDTGIGISQEVMDNLFSPFKQAQSFAGGTGLGLYSLAKRSDALGGYYGVRARNDGIQGSVFWFAIPYKPDSVNAKLHAKLLKKVNSAVSMKSLLSSSSDRSKKFSETSLSESINSVTKKKASHFGQHTGNNDNQDLINSTDAVVKPEEKKEDEEEFEFHYASEQILEYNMSGRSLISDTDLDSIQGNEEILPLAPMNILLVDDSAAILKLTGKMLRKQGHTVTEAVNGEENLRKLAEVRNDQTNTMKPYDVVIIDLHMPVMDGIESTTRLRKIEKELSSAMIPYKRQLVILCSANNDKTTKDLAYKAGCDYVLTKPLSVAEFHNQYNRLTNADDYFI